MAVKNYRFPVTTDGGGTGTSDTQSINGILQTVRIRYADSADAGTDVTVRGVESDGVYPIHTQTDNNTDITTLPSEGSPRLLAGSFEVYASGVGGAIANAVIVTLEVLE